MAEFKCKECDKEFHGKQGYEDHMRSKHYVAKKESSGKGFGNKYIWIFAVIVLIVAALFLIPSAEAEPGKYDEFAQCLTDNGVKMYGAYWCSHCEEQKKDFGDSFHLVDYVECSLANNRGQTQDCIDEGIQSYPTWEFGDGVRSSGVVSFEKLAERTGCVLPE